MTCEGGEEGGEEVPDLGACELGLVLPVGELDLEERDVVLVCA